MSILVACWRRPDDEGVDEAEESEDFLDELDDELEDDELVDDEEDFDWLSLSAVGGVCMIELKNGLLLFDAQSTKQNYKNDFTY